MNCSRYQSLFTAYLDGGLSDEERRKIEAHLMNCNNCQEVLNQISLIISKTKELERKETSPYFVSKVMSRIKEEETRFTTVTGRLKLRLTVTFASLIVIILIGSFSYYHFKSGIFRSESPKGPVLHGHTLVVEKVSGVSDTILVEKREVGDGYLMEVEFTNDDSTVYLLPVYSSEVNVMSVSY